MELRRLWSGEANRWIEFARSKSADPVFWHFNLPRFLEVVPPAGDLTLDIGCGEGRVARALSLRGHRVVAIDAVERLALAASTHPDGVVAAVGDAAALPLQSGVADLVVLFMVVTDVDDLEGTMIEAGRALRTGGRLCVAMGHPIQGVGDFSGEDREGNYVLDRPYFQEQRLTYWAERAGRRVALHFIHRPLGAYMSKLSSAGFLIGAISEPYPEDDLSDRLTDLRQRQAVPSVIHLRALKAEDR